MLKPGWERDPDPLKAIEGEILFLRVEGKEGEKKAAYALAIVGVSVKENENADYNWIRKNKKQIKMEKCQLAGKEMNDQN